MPLKLEVLVGDTELISTSVVVQPNHLAGRHVLQWCDRG